MSTESKSERLDDEIIDLVDIISDDELKNAISIYSDKADSEATLSDVDSESAAVLPEDEGSCEDTPDDELLNDAPNSVRGDSSLSASQENTTSALFARIEALENSFLPVSDSIVPSLIARIEELEETNRIEHEVITQQCCEMEGKLGLLIQTLTSRVDGLTNKVSQFSPKDNSLPEMSSIEERIGSVSNRMSVVANNLEERFEELSSHVEALSEQNTMPNVSSLSDTLSGVQSHVNEELSALSELLSNLEKRVDDVLAKVHSQPSSDELFESLRLSVEKAAMRSAAQAVREELAQIMKM